MRLIDHPPVKHVAACYCGVVAVLEGRVHNDGLFAKKSYLRCYRKVGEVGVVLGLVRKGKEDYKRMDDEEPMGKKKGAVEMQMNQVSGMPNSGSDVK